MSTNWNYQYHEWKKKRQDTERRVKSQWVQPELPYNTVSPHQQSAQEQFFSHVSKSNRISDRDFHDLFWNHLVHVGWRIDTDSCIVLTCLKCDQSLFSVDINTIDKMEQTKTSYLRNPKEHISRHTCKEEGNDAVRE